jgi:hypothetical protein
MFAGDGTGALAAPVNSSAAAPSTTGQSASAVGDFDEDGKLDVAVAKLNNATLTVLLGDGTGKFVPAPTNANYATGGFPFDVASADLDADGHLDLVTADFNSSDVSMYFGDGTGHFVGPPSPISPQIKVGDFPTALDVVDLNLDGFPEVAVTQDKGVTIVSRFAGRQYMTTKIALTGAPSGIAAGYIDSDLFPDLVVGDSVAANVRILANKAPKSGYDFAVGPAISTGSAFGASTDGVQAGDLNGDGKTDVAVEVANGGLLLPQGEPTVRTLIGDGLGGLTPGPSVIVGRDPESIELADLNADGTLDIVVADADDGVYVATNGCAGSTQLDITAVSIEAVQVIQDVANSVPLIEGKRTVVRGHVTATRSATGIAARLVRLDAAGNPLDSVLPINPLGRITVKTAPRRELADDSFRFELPEPWTHGALKLRLEVNAQGLVNESNASNNSVTATLNFVPAKKLKITLVDYRWDTCADGDHVQDDYVCKPGSSSAGLTPEFPTDWMDRIESDLRRRMPVAAVDIQRTSLTDPDYRTIHSCCIQPDVRELNRVMQLHQSMQTAGAGRIFLWLSKQYHPGAAYVYDPTHPEWGFDAVADSWDSAVHEVGHALGVKHTLCAGDEKNPGPYPYPGGLIGGPSTNPTQFVGYSMPDALQAQFASIVPPTVGDEMSYCDPRWPSDVTYKAWRNTLQTRPEFVDPTGDFILVDGTIKVDGSATLGAVQRLAQVAMVTTATTGPYHVRLLDAAGGVITDYPLAPGSIVSHADSSDLGFSAVFNWAPGTRRVAFVNAAGVELASRTVSASAPSIAGVTQGGGPVLPASGSVAISWNASDADGDALRASIQYSMDSGATWNAVATGVAGSSYAVDATSLAGTKGSSTGRFRVLVSDGVLTAAAQTATFTVPGHAPAIAIVSPFAGTRLELGQNVMLEAVALDREDGVLDAGVSWSSDRDGALGSGRLLSARLGEGAHIITVTATDSGGATATATTSVHVTRGNVAGSPPVANAGADISAVEGATVTLNGAGSSDPDGDSLSYSWSVVGAPTETVDLRNAGTAAPSFVATDDGVYTLRLTVSDGLSALVSDDVAVTVSNVAPVVTINRPASGQLFPVGPVTIAAVFSDPGVEDEHTCRINWDVDLPTLVDSGVVNHTLHTCSATRTLDAGVYTIAVSVDDGDGGVGTAQVQVVVYDPSAGFVTGSGWIAAPAGRANFGFELRYRNGATVPSGQTEFGYKVGNIDFHSTGYDWLVVVGPKAQFRCSGTLNGVAGYSCLVTVVDGKASGGASAFRIKIWNAAGIVYDNVPGAPDDLDRAAPQAIGGGSVVVHT